MKFWLVLLAAGMTLLASPAAAAIRPYAFFFHPHGGFYDFQEKEDQKDGPVYGIGLGYRFSRNWSSEVIADFIDSKAKEGMEEEIDGYLLRWEAQYGFRPGARLVPYLAAGIGGLLLDHRDGGTDLEGTIGYGIGLQAFVSERVSFRVDGRHFRTIRNQEFEGFNNLMASAGIVLEVGGEEEKPQLIDTDGDGVIDAFDRCPDTPLGVPVDGYGCPADSDGDGVPDFRDKCQGSPSGVAIDRDGCPPDTDGDGVPDHADRCPDTPAGTKVDVQGCPLPVITDSDGDGVEDARDRCPGTPAKIAVDRDGCPPDSDNDGIPDAEDMCPNTSPDIPVDTRGCPADSDQDGVPDVADRCPGTPAGVLVDANGCPPPAPKQSLTLHLQFAGRESELRIENQERLREAIDFVRANPGRRLIVEGHTDSIGPAEANLRLSRQRAENVRRYLLDKTQVDAERITVEAYGESRPIADNATPEGRLQNRRVVLRVMSDE